MQSAYHSLGLVPALLAASLLVAGAGDAVAKLDKHETPASDPGVAVVRTTAALAPVGPPVLHVAPLIELRWLQVFGPPVESDDGEALDADALGPPPVPRIPTGPMYRRDI